MGNIFGTTISPSTSNNVENDNMPTFYTDKLPPSTNLTNDPFNKSADLSKTSIQDNPPVVVKQDIRIC